MPDTESDLNKTIDRLVSLIIRRRWWVLLTACGTALATIFVLARLPNHYSSEAILVVVQPQVSKEYVAPFSTTDTADMIAALTREVLSRTRLVGIVDEFGLFAKARKNLAPEALADLMRHNIDVRPFDPNPAHTNFNAFQISFIADNPQLAQEVTSRLTSLFIEENLKTQENQATSTTSFLQDAMETAKNSLTAQEQRLRDFRMQNPDELPDRQMGNLGILTDLRTQLQTSAAELQKAQEQRVFLEASLSGDLSRLQAEKEKLLAQYTPRYSEVLKKDQDISRTAALVERLKTSTPGTAQLQSLPVPDDPGIVRLKSQLVANEVDIADLFKSQKRLNDSIAQYQNQLNRAPLREQQLAAILRDYDTLKHHYDDLQNKQIQSQMSSNLEKRQEGQSFRLVDSASLPVSPSSPKRLKIALGGAAGGLFLGLALTFLLDMKDTSFHTEKELIQCFPAPVVLAMPVFNIPSEVRWHKWRSASEWLAGCVLTLAVFAAEFYVYRHS